MDFGKLRYTIGKLWKRKSPSGKCMIFIYSIIEDTRHRHANIIYTHIQTRQSIVKLHLKHFTINSESRNINYIEWEEYKSERNNDEINEWQSVMNERMSQSLVQSDNQLIINQVIK